tara:strand:+ start:1289 stop:1474 length:186 start_codon:yes stop_codon:yes gene_type:complete
MGYILYSQKQQKNEIEYLTDEFCKLGIYEEYKRQFSNRSVSVLWIVLERKTDIKQDWAEWK